MTIAGKHAEIANTLIQVVPAVIPFPLSLHPPVSSFPSRPSSEWGVLVGITGDIRGNLLVKGTSQTFGQLGQNLFGMPLEGAMLESFTGELGNMIAGNFSSHIFQRGFSIDITPPTLMTEESSFYQMAYEFSIPINIDQIGDMSIAWIPHE